MEQEEDGRWIAEVIPLPGVMAYGKTQERARARAAALALRVLADLLDRDEAVPEGAAAMVQNIMENLEIK
jgi:predicted RNase H-like HicB family nuclease